MPKYLTKSLGYVEDDLRLYDESDQRSINVWDHRPTPTYILDSDGDMIYRYPRPVGFGRMDEW